MSVFPTVEQASLQIYQQRLSVRPSVSLMCIQHRCIPNLYSLINALGSMNVGLMKICTPLSPSLQIFRPVMTKIKYMYTTTRACTLIVNVSVIIEPFRQYSRNVNLSTLILIPTLPKPTAYFSVISSWRFLNQENGRVCATKRTSTQCPCIYFLITGSEHD